MSQKKNYYKSGSSFNRNILNLSLDEYYENYVAPPSGINASRAQKRRHYDRTHYFSPDYFKRRSLHQSDKTAASEALQDCDKLEINPNTIEQSNVNGCAQKDKDMKTEIESSSTQ